MKILLTILLILIPLGSILHAQDLQELNYKKLQPLLEKDNDTVYVVNFWATWCKPCIEELPHFLTSASEFKDHPVKFIFVSLDFPNQKESRLIPFIKKKNITEQVILLNDPNSGFWINEINKDWSGALPATIIYKGASRSFTEGVLSYQQLTQSIKSKLP